MGTQRPLPQRGTAPQFSAHICCGQMAAWIKMPLGVEVGLGPGDFVLYGDRTNPPQKGGGAPKIFDPCLLCPNGWMDQDGTWHGGRLSPGDFVLDRGPASSPKIFGPFLLWTNGWMHQDATWYGSRPQPRRLCVRWGPTFPRQKGTQPQNFWPMFIVAKRLDGSRWHLAWK